MKKTTISLCITAIAVLLAVGCTQTPFNDPLKVATDLKEMGTLLADIDASLALVEEAEADSRTISGPDISGLTPQQVYDAGTPDGDGVVTAPATGFYRDLYGEDGNDWYITLEPNGSSHYTVKLYIYPRTNFYIIYSYEEYITPKTGWDFFSDTAGTQGFLSLKNFYTDGTTGTRDLVDTATSYAEIPVPEPVLDNLSSYTFTDLASVTAPATGSSVFSSEADEEIKGKGTAGFTIDSTTYYTETSGQTVRSSVAYIVKDYARPKVNDEFTVTRTKLDTAAGTTTVRSLTTDGSGFTQTTVIDKSVTGGVKQYQSSIQKYFVIPSAASGTGTITDSLDITETAAGSNIYTGTRSRYFGSLGFDYDVTIDATTIGSRNMRQSWKNFSSRSTGGTVEIDLDSLDELFIQMPGVFGQFNGRYEQGSLIGTFSTNLRASEVLVTGSGIAVDGEFYYYSDLE